MQVSSAETQGWHQPESGPERQAASQCQGSFLSRAALHSAVRPHVHCGSSIADVPAAAAAAVEWVWLLLERCPHWPLWVLAKHRMTHRQARSSFGSLVQGLHVNPASQQLVNTVIAQPAACQPGVVFRLLPKALTASA